MITLEQARGAIGRPVVYRGPRGSEHERGTISSVNARFVFVRYSEGDTAAATDPAHLTFADPADRGEPEPIREVYAGEAGHGVLTVEHRRALNQQWLTCRLDGVPAMKFRDPAGALVDGDPQRVRFTYHQITPDDDGQPRGWTVEADVWDTTGRFRMLLADEQGDYEWWPDWLRGWADKLHPDRPGGWPGDDPEGSYL